MDICTFDQDPALSIVFSEQHAGLLPSAFFKLFFFLHHHNHHGPLVF
jgi:hypothetical protein